MSLATAAKKQALAKATELGLAVPSRASVAEQARKHGLKSPGLFSLGELIRYVRIKEARLAFDSLLADGLMGYSYDFATAAGVPHCWLKDVERYVHSQVLRPDSGRIEPQELMLTCLKTDAKTLARWVSRGLPKRFDLKQYERDVWRGYTELVREQAPERARASQSTTLTIHVA